MSTPRRKSSARSHSRRKTAPGRDFWGPDVRDDEVDDIEIRPLDDSTALIRSLGPPPLPGHETAAEHYFAAVYDKAANLAIALAAASDLLVTDEPDD